MENSRRDRGRAVTSNAFDEGAHLGLVAALIAAGRHGEARRRYGYYATKMEEISVEAAPFPSAHGAAAPSGSSLASATR